MKKYALILPILIISFGCGSSGGGDNKPQFIYNSEGYPEVSGNYNMSIGKVKNNCGYAEGIPVVINASVIQEGSNIIFKNINDNTYDTFKALGFNVVDESDMEGAIQKNGDFSTTRGLTLEHETGATLYINYAMSGTFRTAGIKGQLMYTIFDTLTSCTYEAIFTASKI